MLHAGGGPRGLQAIQDPLPLSLDGRHSAQLLLQQLLGQLPLPLCQLQSFLRVDPHNHSIRGAVALSNALQATLNAPWQETFHKECSHFVRCRPSCMQTCTRLSMRNNSTLPASRVPACRFAQDDPQHVLLLRQLPRVLEGQCVQYIPYGKLGLCQLQAVLHAPRQETLHENCRRGQSPCSNKP